LLEGLSRPAKRGHGSVGHAAAIAYLDTVQGASMNYQDIIAARRSLKILGYRTLAEAGFDGQWVTPYQMASCAPDGPVFVAYNWLDFPSVDLNREVLSKLGYLPSITFNRVLDKALKLLGISRRDIYMTQAFHLLPATRSASIRRADVDVSFDAVTRHELVDRQVIALGDNAMIVCNRHGVRHRAVCHPSARGMSHSDKAIRIAEAVNQLR
jgi:hypothetical protein